MTETMRADGLQLAGTKPDVSSLLGTWVNCKPDTDHITRITVSAKDDALFVNPSSAVLDWGPAEAKPYVASGKTESAGFHASYTFGQIRTELAANEKFGVLVIQSYTSLGDDRLSHYSREFFYRLPAEPLTGKWTNTYPHTEWITAYTLTDDTLHIFAATEPTDWGTTQVTRYVDNLGEPGFRAAYSFEDFSALLVMNTNKGLSIITAFLDFNGDKENYLCREFFVPS